MKRFLIFFSSFLFIYQTAKSQEIDFLRTDWENPAVFEKGQNLPHAFHIPFASGLEALKKKESEYITSEKF